MFDRVKNFFRKDTLNKVDIKKHNKFAWFQYIVNVEMKEFHNAVQNALNYKSGNRMMLYKMYDNLMSDNYYQATYKIRKANSLAGQYYVEGADITEVIELYPSLSNSIFESIMYGDTLLELINGKYEILDRAYIIPELNTIIDGSSKRTKITINAPQMLKISNADNPFGEFRSIAANIILKKLNLTQWANFSAKYGNPSFFFRSNEKDKDMNNAIIRVMNQMRRNGSMVMPDGIEYEVIEPTKTDVYNIFNKFVEVINKEISSLMVGSSGLISTESNRSQTQVQKELFDNNVTYLDKIYIEEKMSELLSIIFNTKVVFKYEKPIDTEMYLKTLESLTKMGIDFDKNEVKNKLNIK